MRRPRREEMAHGLLVALVVVCIGLVGALLLIQRVFEPRDGLLGIPNRMLACGRDYIAGWTGLTRAQIAQGLPPGISSVVFEPVIGEIPLTAPFEARPAPSGTVCDTVIFLHVGPDSYVAYDLEGGP